MFAESVRQLFKSDLISASKLPLSYPKKRHCRYPRRNPKGCPFRYQTDQAKARSHPHTLESLPYSPIRSKRSSLRLYKLFKNTVKGHVHTIEDASFNGYASPDPIRRYTSTKRASAQQTPALLGAGL